MTSPAPAHNVALGFTIPARNARGRVVKLSDTLDLILSHHNYPPVIAKLLAEALVLTALLGSLLKEEEGQLTVQAQSEGGIVSLLVCDYRNGELRGYIQHDDERLAEIGPTPSLFGLFGKGYLAITFDQIVSGERYQGIVPLEGASLADAAQSYFAQSEQLPSLVRIAADVQGETGNLAGGLLMQYLPEGEEGRTRLHVDDNHPGWSDVEALALTVSPAELIDDRVAPDLLLWRLFNEEQVHILPTVEIKRGCRCTLEYYKGVLSRFPAEERAHMADEQGIIGVDCAFCAKLFPIVAAEL
ncbi:Hsp33 family molecular chaperone HslO [Aquisediminimonas sediminicola]|uniref:Hsp33 family molecular chaperone HslO n=1 Tax=Alteraquisediminimonas sediminicola TaxID=2676787 RepID=UPI001C8E577E|nr:Hsp33 family molecular chaperone HslO [Aquisediminimonas sediminicola]